MSISRRASRLTCAALLSAIAGCASNAQPPSSHDDSVAASRPAVSLALSTSPVPASPRRKVDPPKRHAPRTGVASGHRERAALGSARTFPPAPQLRSVGGPVLSAPRIVPVYYPDDPLFTQKQAFLAKLAPSAYWAATTAEYGVGPATITASYTRPETAPASITDADIQAWLAATVTAAGSPLPVPTGEEIYTLFFPPQTAVLLPDGNGGMWTGCVQYGSYHGWVTLPSGAEVAYAVILSCNGYLDGLAGIDSITDAASHELIEAVTDPYGLTYADTDWEASGMAYTAEGYGSEELGDICEFQPAVSVVNPELGFVVQRTWSNAAAAAWHDPCVPVVTKGQPYFNAQPLIGGAAPDPTQAYWVKGVEVAPGAEVTIPVHLFSDAPTKRWKLSAAEEPNPHLTPDKYNQLSFSFDDEWGKDGDIRHLTIKRKPLPPGATLAPLRVAVISTLDGAQNVWWISVGAPAQGSGTPPLPTPCEEAHHPPLPQVLSLGGSAVLKTPRIVPVLFPGDTLAAPLEDFLAKLGTSSYFVDSTREYGVQSLSVAAPFVASAPPAAQVADTDIVSWLTTELGDPSFPAADANGVYALFYPATTTLFATNQFGVFPLCGGGGPAIQGTVTRPDGTTVPYLAVPRCPQVTGGFSGIDAATTAASDALFTGVTSPGYHAFNGPDFAGSGWSLATGGVGQLSAMCNGQPEGFTRPSDLGYLVDRVWSDAAAAGGRNPCAPPSSAAYFDAAPVMDGTETYTSFFVSGVTIEPGQSVTIPLRLFSDRRVGDWTLSAVQDFAIGAVPDPYHVLSFAFDEPTGNNGDVRHLTVTRAATPDGSIAPDLSFGIVSTLGSESHVWPVSVGR